MIKRSMVDDGILSTIHRRAFCIDQPIVNRIGTILARRDAMLAGVVGCGRSKAIRWRLRWFLVEK